MVTVSETSERSDELGQRLSEFISELTFRLGDFAVVTRQSLTPTVTQTYFEPASRLACPVSIIEMGDKEWILSISKGGRWEMARTSESLAIMEGLVTAAIEGRVRETLRPGGARVVVTTSDEKLHISGVQSVRMTHFAERKKWWRKHNFAPYV
jgi:hypothetical protein